MFPYASPPSLRGHTARIRLMKLTPGTPPSLIRCTLQPFELNRTPPYLALSYEWGPESPTSQIEVQGQTVRIRLNLRHFLSQLLSSGYHEVWLWCDALCIDQSSRAERNHQVQLMSRIYRRAQRVLVWLGDAPRGDSACSTLHAVRELSSCTDLVSQAALLERRALIWQGLAALSRKRYWHRVWIVQEITVARAVLVFCGGESLDLQTLGTACKFPPDQLTPWATHLWSPLRDANSAQRSQRSAAGRELHHSIMYGLCRAQRRWPTSIDSFETLSARYRQSGCADERDRVFALLGIAKEIALERGFVADYRKSVEETFIALVAWGGTGPVAVHARIRFARMAARAMNLSWPSYELESSLGAEESAKSRNFTPRWAGRGLAIRLRCQSLGKWTPARGAETVAKVSPDIFAPEPVSVHLPLAVSGNLQGHEFEFFWFPTTNILLACEAIRPRTSTVLGRAYFDFNKSTSQGRRQFSGQSVFKGLSVSVETGEQCSVELRSVAQFMEVLLDTLDPRVLRQSGFGGSARGAPGSFARPNRDEDDRGLEAMLQGLKITSGMTLLAESAEGAAKEQNEEEEEESLDADFETLLAESDALAKARVPKALAEKPKRRRDDASKRSIAEVDWDPLCERTSMARDDALSLPLLSDMPPPLYCPAMTMPCSFATVPFGRA